MTLGFLFWLIMFLVLLFGGYIGWSGPVLFLGFNGLLWVLLFLLGVKVFGWPIKE